MKKSFMKIIAVLLSSMTVMSCMTLLSACGCNHEVNKWKTVKEPTCTSTGLRRGVCSECGEVIEESVDPVEDNHVYGDWVITKQPTSSLGGAGEAVKTCKENSEHYIKVTLPRLTSNGAGYDVYEVTKEATVIEEGEVTAVKNTDNGSIVFTAPIAKKEFDPSVDGSVADAVLLGSSNRDLVRGGTGSLNDGWSDGDGSFSYEYGEDYVHTYDGERHVFVSLTSSGTVYGVTSVSNSADSYPDPIVNSGIGKKNLEGYEYPVRRAGRTFYGAEGLLYYSYDWATRNDNNDFYESVTEKKINGTLRTVYTYSFGYYNAPQYFCKFKVEFTLDDDGVLDYIRMDTDSYVQNVQQSDGSADYSQFEVIRDGDKTICRLTADAGKPMYEEYIEYHQTTKAQSPEEPEHLFTEKAFMVESFDLVDSDGKIIGADEDSAASAVAAGDPLTLFVRNVQPSTASVDMDEPFLYLKSDSGRLIALDYASSGVWYTFQQRGTAGYVFKIYFKMSGAVTLVAKTKNGYEKTFIVNVSPASPSVLYPAVYEYGDKGYSWRTGSEQSSIGYYINTEVYVGQSLKMTAQVLKDEAAYVDGGYKATLAAANEAVTLTTSEDTGETTFVATQAGSYTVLLTSTKNKNRRAIVVVSVIEPPSMTEILSGDYSGKLKKGEATVSFGETDADGKITATLTTRKGEEVLSVYYDVEKGKLVTEHIGGATLGVSLEINEAYKLVFVNPTGFGSGKERVVVYRVEDTSEAE